MIRRSALFASPLRRMCVFNRWRVEELRQDGSFRVVVVDGGIDWGEGVVGKGTGKLSRLWFSGKVVRRFEFPWAARVLAGWLAWLVGLGGRCVARASGGGVGGRKVPVYRVRGFLGLDLAGQ